MTNGPRFVFPGHEVWHQAEGNAEEAKAFIEGHARARVRGRLEGLEEAAKVCDALWVELGPYAEECAKEIRALIVREDGRR